MTVYEVFVRSFRDSNDDGIGDLRGILEGLWYLEYLGVDTLWLTPIFPSPSYHGYDVTDYFNVNSLYGSLEFFKEFVERLHQNGFRVIIDLPLNHTSLLHRWFSERPDYYLWAGDDTDLNERRPWDGQFIWHPSKRGYYHGLFGACMPDLNYSNPEVVDRAKEIVKFWAAMGVDGFRFDAAKHIFENHEENLNFWRKISEEIGKIRSDAVLVAEVWDHPRMVMDYVSVLGYAFNFHVFGALKKSVMDSNPLSLKSALEESEEILSRSFNFLSNHDVSRLASDIPDERKRILAFSILMTIPGIPVIYYGDELGVPGIYDPNFPEDVVEPFPWYENPCGKGQTRWKSSRFTRPFHGFSVEYQSENPSFLRKIREILRFRKENDWIDRAVLRNLRVEGNSLVYTLEGEKRLEISHDFNIMETKIDGDLLVI